MSRKIILSVAISLDGMIEGPNGEYDWCFMDQDYGMKEFLSGIDAILYGRKSYELLVKQFGDKDPNGRKKMYVVSNTLPENSRYTLIRGDVSAQLKSLKAQPGKNIWLFGGAALAASLFEMKLIDHLWLAVHPIILGKGTLLFPTLEQRTELKLVSSKVFSTGLVSLNYDVLY